MDHPIHTDAISMDFKGVLVKISITWCISVNEDYFYFSKQYNPDEMPPKAAFHLGLHCLPKYMFIQYSIQNEKVIKKTFTL